MATSIAVRPENDLAAFLQSKSGELSAICSKALTPQRVIQLTMLCAYKTPKLLECERGSVLACVCQAASMNLDLNPSAGEAYLIPRRNKEAGVMECTLQIGYQGLAKCARSSGAVRLVQARSVRKGDHFKVTYINDTPNVVHEPKMAGEAGEITHVYATAKLATGESQVEVMTADEVEHVRERYSLKPDSGPWADSWGEMAKKTVVRRLCKSLPKSTELVQAMELHDAEFVVAPQIEGPKEAVDNNSGFGRGTYASDEDAKRWLSRAEQFLEMRNSRWRDHWFKHFDGDVPNDVHDPCNIFQLDAHCVKWAIEVGHLERGSTDDQGLKRHQLGKLTGILFLKRGKKVQQALVEECQKYFDEQERVQLQKIEKKYPGLGQDDPEETTDDESAVDAAMDEIADGGAIE